MPTFYAIRWRNNGKLFTETRVLYTAGGGVCYIPVVDLNNVDDVQRIKLFESGAAASKFKYEMYDRMLDEKLKARPQEGTTGSLDQLEIVSVEITVK